MVCERDERGSHPPTRMPHSPRVLSRRPLQFALPRCWIVTDDVRYHLRKKSKKHQQDASDADGQRRRRLKTMRRGRIPHTTCALASSYTSSNSHSASCNWHTHDASYLPQRQAGCPIALNRQAHRSKKAGVIRIADQAHHARGLGLREGSATYLMEVVVMGVKR
jgi:hypothetical protein